MQITIHDFSGVYSEQKFMQSLHESSKALWLDSTGIAGTDCYCDDDAVVAIREQIADAGIQNAEGIHFIDGGNYHYMSKIWTDMVQEPFTLVVFDHHPDMQAPRFGGILSCGSWVLEVLNTNKFVEKVILVGVADHLVDEIRQEIASDASNDAPSILDKVTFIKESELPSVSLEGRSPDRVHHTFHIPHSTSIYLSIDKDALAPAFAATNWDQGSLSTESLKSIIASLAANHKIIGVDICGERARDIEDSRADALNNGLNRELAEFLLEIL